MTNSTGLYLILAAGFARRFGSPKLLHPLPTGITIIDSTILALQSSDYEFVVVIREDDTAISNHLKSQSIKTIKVTNAHQGLSSVMAEATRKLDLNRFEWLGICLGDMPYIQSKTLKALPNHISNNTIVRPRHLNQVGHPVLFGRKFFSELIKLEGDFGAKEIIQSHSESLNIIGVEDAMVLHDIDEAKDIIKPN